MKKLFFFLIFLTGTASAQSLGYGSNPWVGLQANAITTVGPTLPTFCDPNLGQVAFKVTGSTGMGSGVGLPYWCSAPGVWTAFAGTSTIADHTHASSGGQGGQLNASNIFNTGTVPVARLPVMVGDSGGGGTAGLVPAPSAGDAAAGKFLKADGTWFVPAGGGGGTPGGSSGQVQFNNSGAFGGISGSSVSGSNVAFTSHSLGTNPATAGTLRFGDGNLIEARNSGNSADIEYIKFNNGNLELNRASGDGTGVQIGSFGRVGFGAPASGSGIRLLIPVDAGVFTTGIQLSDLVSIYAGLTVDAGNSHGGGFDVYTGGQISFAPSGGGYTTRLSSTALRLGIPSGNTVALELAVSGSANTQKIQGADTPASNIVYKLPAADPAIDQHLDVTAFSGGIATTSWTNTIKQPGTNGQLLTVQTLSENLTLSTGGTTTDTSANLLPADSIILDCSGRVTTTITTATDWKLGDATIADRFSSANATMIAGTTQVGINQWKADRTTAGQGGFQSAAAKVRVTTTGTPGAGAIRITCRSIALTAPTS